MSQPVPTLNVNYWIVILGLPFCHCTSHALKNKQCALRKFIHCRVSPASLPFQACSIPWFFTTPHVMKALLEAFSPGPPNLAHRWSPTLVTFEKRFKHGFSLLSFWHDLWYMILMIWFSRWFRISLTLKFQPIRAVHGKMGSTFSMKMACYTMHCHGCLRIWRAFKEDVSIWQDFSASFQ